MNDIEPTEPQDNPGDQPENPRDPEEADDAEPVDLASRRFDAWRRRSAIGGVATGVALGLQEIFGPTQNKPVITAEAPGDPPDADQRPRVFLDPDDPTKSIVVMPLPSPSPNPSSSPRPEDTD